jgi:hypothetical protein
MLPFTNLYTWRLGYQQLPGARKKDTCLHRDGRMALTLRNANIDDKTDMEENLFLNFRLLRPTKEEEWVKSECRERMNQEVVQRGYKINRRQGNFQGKDNSESNLLSLNLAVAQ